MWGPPRAAAGSPVTEAYAAAAHAARRGGAAVSSSLSGLRGRHSLCSVQLMDGLRSNIQAEANLALSPKASMSNGSDDSTITRKGFCTISWNLKADVQHGYLIFITGDPVTLGCWESNMAVQLAPSVESNNIWTAEIKVPYGVHFKYNYFVREEKGSSSDIIWRPGPDYSLSIPSVGQKKQFIVVKDLWMKTSVAGLPAPSWGSWLMEAGSLEGEYFEGGNHWSSAEAHSARDTADQDLSVVDWQRIAVLEDGKLVELLLEPIKNNVQCDSIYLGIVTKLVPHMGGAFVDIGISRPSLMGIKQNRDPFVYPQVVKISRADPVDDSYYNEEYLPTYDEDDDMSDDEFADEETHDGSSSFPVENITDNEEGIALIPDSKIDIVDSAEFEGISGYDEDKEDENGHMEDEYSEEILQADQSEISNDLKTLSSIQHALRESNDDTNGSRWSQVRKGTKIMVQVVKEGLGTKGPTLSPFPCLRSRFWILVSRGNKVGVSKKITGIERTRLKGITKLLRPPGFTLTARTVAAGHSWEELQRDLDGLLSTWKVITEHAQSAALAAEEGVDGAVPVMLHRAKGQALSVVQDDFNEKVKRLVVDSPRTYHEVTSYLQEVAPELCSRVDLYEKRKPIFDEYNIEKEIDNILCKRVPLNNGGSLVIEQTEALVSIDVNGGHSMFGQGTSQEKAILEVNLEAAKQIARELRLRDIGGIIVVDFIDMTDDLNKRLVYEEMKKAVEKDRSTVGVSELSKLGLMEITRKRVRPSVTFMISEPCTCCHGTGRVEALDTSFSKIEHEICRRLAASRRKSDPEKPKSWPRFVLRVDHEMCTYLTSGKKTKLGLLSSSLKVWILLKIARGFSRGAFELLPYSEKENDEKETASESPQKEGSPKLSVFPIKKWMSRAKRAK
ncbi:hypothetical protein PVAP13_6NG155900 [Panicum virgatum]|uniref:CBM20 domain-containing protein n=1 Tax=Panicum virgatum TaxID=38727 RepID=A0A8T0QYA5_PANVG|nr:hypothetical protein PVAP13_6NG155900 [Panicum virgatum]